MLDASNWVYHAERIVAGANVALAIDDHEMAEDGFKVAVFPDGKKIGKPIAPDVVRARNLKEEVGNRTRRLAPDN
jgi:hypothetical protein